MAEQPLSNGRLSSSSLSVIVGFIAALLTLMFVVLTASTLVGLRFGNMLLHPSPFEVFEAVWPGQPVASLATYVRQTTRGHLPCLTGASPSRDYLGLDVRVPPGAYCALGTIIKCADYPKDSMFRAVSLTIEHDRIEQLELYSDILPQDVLLLYWGMPDSITPSGNPQLVQLYWDRSTYSAIASVVKSDSVVKLITLTATE